jgi:type II secretory pathway predicted ATPase ExeA
MYCEFYQLTERPFNVTPDPKFLYLNARYREAIASLNYGITQRKGFITLIGEAGTGKTTLLKRLLEDLDPKTKTVFIFNTNVTFEEILEYIFAEFDLPVHNGKKLYMLQRLNTFLLEELRSGGNVALLIDEAQDLEFSVLEDLRLLSNLETAKEKILQIVLSGQPELGQKLSNPILRQLRQRISINCRLLPLSRDEITEYLQYRLQAAGSPDLKLFTREAEDSIYHFSRGVPRLVNVVCDNALVIGYALGKKRIGADIIKEAAADLLPVEVHDAEPTKAHSAPAAAIKMPGIGKEGGRWGRAGVVGLAVLGVVVVLLSLFRTGADSASSERIEIARAPLKVIQPGSKPADRDRGPAPIARQAPVAAEAPRPAPAVAAEPPAPEMEVNAEILELRDPRDDARRRRIAAAANAPVEQRRAVAMLPPAEEKRPEAPRAKVAEETAPRPDEIEAPAAKADVGELDDPVDTPDEEDLSEGDGPVEEAPAAAGWTEEALADIVASAGTRVAEHATAPKEVPAPDVLAKIDLPPPAPAEEREAKPEPEPRLEIIEESAVEDEATPDPGSLVVELDDETDDGSESDGPRLDGVRFARIRVQEGDSVSGIALRRYGQASPTILDLLKLANPNVSDIDRIVVGQTIRLPQLDGAFPILNQGEEQYSLLVFSSSESWRASDLRDELRSRGFAAEVSHSNLGAHKPVHRVIVSGFRSRDDVLDAGKRLQRLFREDARIAQLGRTVEE